MPPTGQPTIRVDAPQPNSVVKSGDVLTVAGLATGVAGIEPHPGHPGHEPVHINSVTVALAGASSNAALTLIPPHIGQAPAAKFTAKLKVPMVGGIQQLEVVAQADNGSAARANVPLVVHGTPPAWMTSELAPAAALPQAARLTAIAKPVGCELWWIGRNGTVNGCCGPRFGVGELSARWSGAAAAEEAASRPCPER